jgi:hypothetical protein
MTNSEPHCAVIGRSVSEPTRYLMAAMVARAEPLRARREGATGVSCFVVLRAPSRSPTGYPRFAGVVPILSPSLSTVPHRSLLTRS